MWQVKRTGGVLVLRATALDGMTWQAYLKSCDSSAVIVWNARSNQVLVSVVRGDYLCQSEWWTLDSDLGLWDMEERILMALERWQEQCTQLVLGPSPSTSNDSSAVMMMDLVSLICAPAESS